MIADAISIDVEKYFPEILEIDSTNQKKLDDNFYRGKYYSLLEKYNGMIEKHNLVLEERAEYVAKSSEKE